MGLWFDECEVGLRLHHALTRTVTETDNLLFSVLTHNAQPLHLDAEVARKSEFGSIIVNSMFTYSLMVGVSVADTTLGTLVANLGLEKLRTPKPVRIGDTLRIETTVLAKRPSESRPGQGIVQFEHRAYNQHGELVASCERTALLHSRPA
jgi:acyl dehydratase